MTGVGVWQRRWTRRSRVVCGGVTPENGLVKRIGEPEGARDVVQGRHLGIVEPAERQKSKMEDKESKMEAMVERSC